MGQPVALSSSPPAFHPSSLHPSISSPEEFTLKSRPLMIRFGLATLLPEHCTPECSVSWVVGIPCWRFESTPDPWAPVAAHVPGCSGTGFCPDGFSSHCFNCQWGMRFSYSLLVLEVKQSCLEEKGRGLFHILIWSNPSLIPRESRVSVQETESTYMCSSHAVGVPG